MEAINAVRQDSAINGNVTTKASESSIDLLAHKERFVCPSNQYFSGIVWVFWDVLLRCRTVLAFGHFFPNNRYQEILTIYYQIFWTCKDFVDVAELFGIWINVNPGFFINPCIGGGLNDPVLTLELTDIRADWRLRLSGSLFRLSQACFQKKRRHGAFCVGD